MSSSPKLRVCPFCGSNDLSNTGHAVECNKCYSQGPGIFPVPNRNKTIPAWNRRAGDEELIRRLEEIQRFVSQYDELPSNDSILNLIEELKRK
jgi:hypothetical protein